LTPPAGMLNLAGMASSEEKPSGYTVTDRRSFAAAEASKTSEAPPAAPGPTEAVHQPAPSEPADKLPPVDFSTFVLSLGSSALMHLGELERPGAGKAHKDLALAKHTIDLLSMLQAKTQGNLNANEATLLDGLLYDLRLRFVTASKA
jgi:hypothetical protein